MIQTVKIPRKFMNGDSRVSQNWVSNGHWAIIKPMLTNAEQATYASAETASKLLGLQVREIPEEDMLRVFPKGDLKKWKFTGKAHLGCLDARADRLEYACGDERAYFNREYINMAMAKGRGVSCETLLGTDSESSFIDEDKCFVIMPVRI